MTQTAERSAARGHHKSWYSFDTSYQRLQLFSPWTIAGFSLALSLGLVLVYPHKTLEQRLNRDGQKPDLLTVEYMKAFIKADPSATGLHLALAKQLVQLGSFQEARSALAPLLNAPNPKWQVEAGFLELEMRAQEAFAISEQLPRHKELIGHMQEQMHALLRLPLNSEQLAILGRQALVAGESSVYGSVFRRVAEMPPTLPAEFYAETARNLLGFGEYRTCARLFLRAMEKTAEFRQKHEYFLEALRAYRASNLFGEALDAAERYIGPLHNDTETLLFLTRFAQAANRLDIAEGYAKRLLKLSLDNPLLYAPVAMQPIAIPAPGKPGGAPGLPFHDEAYTLGFDVFMANGNLTDARRVAVAAVQYRLGSGIWRKRLAQVSEWSNLPQEALAQWLAYARQTKDEAGWDAVLRLSESLFDQKVLRFALNHKLVSDPRNKNWLNRLLTSHEANGDPERAISLLQSRLKAGQEGRRGTQPEERQREMQLLADIAQRAGRDNIALQALGTLQTEFGPQAGSALRIANFLYQKGQVRAAFSALEQGVAAATASDTEFWRAYANLGLRLQDDKAAQTGYQRLLETGRNNESDLQNLLSVLADSQPRSAAELAEYAYEKTSGLGYVKQALTYWYRVGNWERAQQLLQRVPREQVQVLEKDFTFLSIRASIRQATKDIQGAERDLRQAIQLNPEDMDLRSGLIWILIAKRDTQQLKQALGLWAKDAEQHSLMWAPFAAANMAINRQNEALYWFRKPGFVQNDYLWMMSYAEVLEANAQPEMAWRIRRKVWQDLRNPAILTKAEPEQLHVLRGRLASVAHLFAGGDDTQRVIQTLLHSDLKKLVHPSLPTSPARTGTELVARLTAVTAASEAADDARLTVAAREVALAYALSRDSHDLARAWLAARFAKQLEKPLWGELSLALATDDRTKFNQLLDDLPDWLPMYERIEAAHRAGRPALAQTLAFEQLARLPHDDQLHLRLTTLTSKDAAGVQFSLNTVKDAALQTNEKHVDTSINIATGMKLTLALKQHQHQSTNSSQLPNIPARDEEMLVTLRKLTETGHWTASLSRREASAGITVLRLAYSLSPARGVTVTGSVGHNEAATESALLRLAAARSGMESTVSYAFSRSEYGSVGINWYRYLSQSGTELGLGRGMSAELGSHLRLEYPNITLRAFAARREYAATGQSDMRIAQFVPVGSEATGFRYMPAGSSLYGVSLGLGTVVETTYSRALRPFFELGLTYSGKEGGSYNVRGGFAGSIIGQDILLLQFQRNGASTERPQGLQEIGLQYKWLY